MSAGILIVDDDRDLSSMLAEFLGHEGFQVATIEEGGGALGLIAERPFDLVILDVMLPGSSGFDVLREIRQRKPRLPVLMLTARGEAIDRILGLELGADDYLPKPFDPRELAARVRAILRRAATVGDNTQSSESADSFFVGTLRMDIRRRRATLGGAPLELTGAEFRVSGSGMSSDGRSIVLRATPPAGTWICTGARNRLSAQVTRNVTDSGAGLAIASRSEVPASASIHAVT
ncbi:MAG: DNA-binding response regulator, partial [Gammaproteobacteria bacterium]|nr:DNA-binding response regulator [Gammaproteobacteria bacterium]